MKVLKKGRKRKASKGWSGRRTGTGAAHGGWISMDDRQRRQLLNG